MLFGDDVLLTGYCNGVVELWHLRALSVKIPTNTQEIFPSPKQDEDSGFQPVNMSVGRSDRPLAAHLPQRPLGPRRAKHRLRPLVATVSARKGLGSDLNEAMAWGLVSGAEFSYFGHQNTSTWAWDQSGLSVEDHALRLGKLHCLHVGSRYPDSRRKFQDCPS